MIGKIDVQNFSVVIDDGPISNFYLNYFLQNDIKPRQIYYLYKKQIYINKIDIFLNFTKNNYHALRLMKYDCCKNLIEEAEKFFKFNIGFCFKSYSFSKLSMFNSKFVSDPQINSEKLYNILKNDTASFILNTSNKILKNILNINKKFIHIHPAYLPDVRGADGTLNSILKKNCLGASAFIMNSKIDEGIILAREKYDIPNFKTSIDELSLKDRYRAWYSFIDPFVRVKILDKFFYNKHVEIKQLASDGKYFGFLNENEIINAFDKVFKFNK